jgi:hypothetical protein
MKVARRGKEDCWTKSASEKRKFDRGDGSIGAPTAAAVKYGAMGMDWLLITLLPVVLSGGLFVGLPVYFVRRYLKLRERQVAALEAQQGGPDRLRLEEENRNLRERIEKLETVITSGDFELNRRLAALELPGEPKLGTEPPAGSLPPRRP